MWPFSGDDHLSDPDPLRPVRRAVADRPAQAGLRAGPAPARRRHDPRTADQDGGAHDRHRRPDSRGDPEGDLAEPGDALHEGHARLPALRLLGADGRRPDTAGAEFAAMDILPDPRIRQQLSAHSGWPTIPQLFVDGELVGGCDIVTELYETGELGRDGGAGCLTGLPSSGRGSSACGRARACARRVLGHGVRARPDRLAARVVDRAARASTGGQLPPRRLPAAGACGRSRSGAGSTPARCARPVCWSTARASSSTPRRWTRPASRTSGCEPAEAERPLPRGPVPRAGAVGRARRHGRRRRGACDPRARARRPRGQRWSTTRASSRPTSSWPAPARGSAPCSTCRCSRGSSR